MGKTLADIAMDLKNSEKKVQIIFAFNGAGKTRLSCEFKRLFRQGTTTEETGEEHKGVLYYNAFTEDLFYWNNDLDNDVEMKMIIQRNAFTDWVYKDEGKEKDIQNHFSKYTNSKIEANYDPNYREVSFSIPGEEDSSLSNIKISKSEESCFIWCVFYSLLESIIDDINDNKSSSQFIEYKYFFIDDPVSSLDENHLIELAVNLSELITKAPNDVRFVITTHNALFFNVLCSQKSKAAKSFLRKLEDNTYILESIRHDSPFSFQHYLLCELQQAICSDKLNKNHFVMIRGVLEKLSIFLGYEKWSDLLDLENASVLAQLINTSSHSHYATEESLFLTEESKMALKHVFMFILEHYHFLIPAPPQEAITQQQ